MKKHDTPLRSEDVRQKNEKLILRAIQVRNGLSQSEAVALTGLKAPTVLRIFTYLEERGLIQVSSAPLRQDPDKKGRKPVYYQVAPNIHYTIGLEFWSQQISIIMTDFQKRVVYEKTLSDISIENVTALVGILYKLIQELLQETKVDREKILGIGVGAPGRIDTDEGKVIYYGRIEGMHGFPLREQLEKQFNIPVFINNNASVAAVNAYRRGKARKADSLITILVRSGVGGAFINSGNLMLVGGRTVMEMGHTVIDMNGPECVCGAKGCLEAYISEQVVLEEAAQKFPITSLAELDQLAGEGNSEVTTFLERKGELLAVAARSIFRLFSPDSFLVMTRFENISRIYAQKVAEVLKNDFYRQETEIQIAFDVYDSVEAGRGAAELVFEDYFSPI